MCRVILRFQFQSNGFQWNGLHCMPSHIFKLPSWKTMFMENPKGKCGLFSFFIYFYLQEGEACGCVYHPLLHCLFGKTKGTLLLFFLIFILFSMKNSDGCADVLLSTLLVFVFHTCCVEYEMPVCPSLPSRNMFHTCGITCFLTNWPGTVFMDECQTN